MHLLTIGRVLVALAATTAVCLIDNAEASMPPLCPNPRVRKEIRDLSEAERQRFFRAILGTMRRPAPNKPSPFDVISYHHNAASALTHGTPVFLPYHRLILDKLDRELRKVDPSVTLPYWDWSVDAQAPEASALLSPGWFGTNGKGPSKCLTDSFYSQFVPFYTTPTQSKKCLQRSFDGGNVIKAFGSPEMIADIVGNSRTFGEFRAKMDGFPHGRVHNGLGGCLASMHSPNDPIFYMHHAFLDKVWYDWQARDPAKRVFQYFGYDQVLRREASLKDTYPAPFAKVPIYAGMSLRHHGQCYRYANPVNAYKTATKKATTRKRRGYSGGEPEPVKSNCSYSGPPSAEDRTFLFELRAPPPLPDEWIKMNNLNKEQIRCDEKHVVQVCDKLNRVEGYVSPAALWNRPSLMEKISKTVTEFHAYVDGKLVSVHNDPTQPGGVDQVKHAFLKAGAKIFDDVREHADALRDILGDGITDVLDMFEEHLDDIYDGAKQLYNAFFGKKNKDSDCDDAAPAKYASNTY